MSDRSQLLITADELAAAVAHQDAGGAHVHLLDVRWRLDRPNGRPDYEAGHIPGAVYVDLDRQLAAIGAAEEGRHPLPPIQQLRADARSWGIDDGDEVVVYDDVSNLSAARAWWLLRHAGIAGVRMLDGGLRAWREGGHPLERGTVSVQAGNVSLGYGHLPVISMDEAGEFSRDGVLLDARAAERYRGDVEPVDPRAGHIPGALNSPTAGNVGDDGRFLDRERLRARFAAVGVADGVAVATYCGSGVTAAHNAAALMLAGFELPGSAPALYPGSWSQWSQHPDRPVATGPEARAVLPGE